MTLLPRSHSLFRQALRDRPSPAIGTWIKLTATESVELMALAGFDFVVIDLEHSAIGMETAFRQIATASLTGLAPIVRVPGLGGGLVQRLLDAGAEGIMVPHVDSPEEAEAAVRAVRFPPQGDRGVGSTSRAGAWGALTREEYLRFGREEVVLIVQLESAAAAAAAASIAAVSGVDAVLIGAADLATSEGSIESDPAVVALIAGAVRDVRAAGIPVGTAGGSAPGVAAAAGAAGYAFCMIGNDGGFLRDAAASAVTHARTTQLSPR